MCGIAGIIGAYNVALIEQLKDAAQIQYHRGPDYFGFSSTSEYALFHNRLSIIDISSKSNQPFEDDNHILIYNGEIYNYKQLAEKKLSPDTDLASDTLVLFQLLKKYGKEIIPELDGMFSFVFIDKDKNTFIGSRDRMGIKPFYFSCNDNTFIFASEIKTVIRFIKTIASYDTLNQLNYRALDSCFALGFGEHQQIPFNHIIELPPGNTIFSKFNFTSIQPMPYFDCVTRITKTSFLNDSESKLIDKLDELLIKSVHLHLLSDVKLGTLCSGGLDSSLITAIAAKKNPDIKIYHACYDGPGNEKRFAEIAAQELKIDIQYIEINARQYLQLLPKAIWHSDLPIYHPNDVSLYLVSSKAKSDGVKVLLCGEGADELFGGYHWHGFFQKINFLHSTINKFVPFTKKIASLFSMILFSKYMSKEEILLHSGSHFNYSPDNIFEFTKRNSILRNPQTYSNINRLAKTYRGLDNNPELAAFITNNLQGHLASLLHRNDRMCMMTSIESRVPFLENTLIDFALNLPTKFKIYKNEKKYLLKKVGERYLPKSIIYRPKMGFPVPWVESLKCVDNAIFDDGFLSSYLSMSSADITNWFINNPSLHFTALSFELWGRIFVFNENMDTLSDQITRS